MTCFTLYVPASLQGDSEKLQGLMEAVRGDISEQFSLGELYERTNNIEALCFIGIDEIVSSIEKMDDVLRKVYERLRNFSQLPCSVRSNAPGTWSKKHPDHVCSV